MNFTLIDWIIVFGTFGFFVFVVWFTKRYNRSVADFLAAGRCGERYMLAVAEGMSGLGSITILAQFEYYYRTGFAITWWSMMLMPLPLFIALSGYVVYRFRETRALTLGEFLEKRYSRKFRIFAGYIIFLSGILNFGIFPAVGTRFFLYFCGLPETLSLMGYDVSTYTLLMGVLLLSALYFTFSGGQIGIMTTDFLQGLFINLVFIAILIWIICSFDWSDIIVGLSQAPKGQSMIDPFDSARTPNFNIWFILIGMFGAFYTYNTWQGSQGYNSSAQSAHEAKMGRVLGNWRGLVQSIVIILLPLCAYMIMNNPRFSSIAQGAMSTLDGISQNPDDVIRRQMTVPVILSMILPKGLLGAFCAVMLAAFIATHDTYLHSWGSIFIQDIIVPLRKKALTPKQHMILLRLSIVGVACFAFIFSLLYKQTDYIYMYFALTGAIWMGGSGAIVVGGLYWKRGTTTAAWVSLILGSSLAFGSLVMEQVWPKIYGDSFPINGQYMWFVSMLSAIFSYVLISLLGKRSVFNLDKLLHRGIYRLEDKELDEQLKKSRGFAVLGIDSHFTRGDKLIYLGSILWTFGWWGVFLIGTAYGFMSKDGISPNTWSKYWQITVWISMIIGIATVIWFTIGGLTEMKRMFATLLLAKRNDSDDGTVVHSKEDYIEIDSDQNV